MEIFQPIQSVEQLQNKDLTGKCIVVRFFNEDVINQDFVYKIIDESNYSSNTDELDLVVSEPITELKNVLWLGKSNIGSFQPFIFDKSEIKEFKKFYSTYRMVQDIVSFTGLRELKELINSSEVIF